MKRTILLTVMFILAFALCACDGDNTAAGNTTAARESASPTPARTEEPAAQTASPQPQIPDEPEPEEEGRGDVIPDEPEEEGRGDVITDSSQGDPGDTGQPEWWGAFAGQDFNQDYAINITEVSEESFYFEILDVSGDGIIYTGTAFLTAIDPYAAEYNEETYLQFYLSADGISIELIAEDDRLTGYYRIVNPNERYELGGRGDIVPDGAGGQGDIFEASDPGDGGMLGWEGTFDNGEYAIEITNFDGLNFDFTVYLTSNGSIYAEGKMTLYPDNPLMGEWDGMSFSLYEDFSAIDIFAPEEDTYTFLRGQYIRE